MKNKVISVPRYSIHTRLREFHLKRLLSNRCRGHLLDVGCGLGYLTEALGGGFVVAGIDLDLSALKENLSRGLNNMLQANAIKLPFKEKSFDIIICSELLEHLREGMDKDALREMARILKPGGRILITVPSLEGVRSASRLRNLGHADESGGEYHYRAGYSYKEIESMVKDIPDLNIRDKRYSLFIFSELFADLLKLWYFKKSKLKEHSDLSKVKDSLLFRVYRFVFPLFYLGFLMEDMLLAPFLKGHIFIAAIERRI